MAIIITVIIITTIIIIIIIIYIYHACCVCTAFITHNAYRGAHTHIYIIYMHMDTRIAM